jgi:hypothetical protein
MEEATEKQELWDTLIYRKGRKGKSTASMDGLNAWESWSRKRGFCHTRSTDRLLLSSQICLQEYEHRHLKCEHCQRKLLNHLDLNHMIHSFRTIIYILFPVITNVFLLFSIEYTLRILLEYCFSIISSFFYVEQSLLMIAYIYSSEVKSYDYEFQW